MDDGRKHETPCRRQRALSLMAHQVTNASSLFALISLVPKSHLAAHTNSDGRPHVSWGTLQKRNPELREPESFSNGK